MISVSEADALLAGLLPPPSSEAVVLDQANGRVLATDVVADRDGPPYDRVAMDGYAVASPEARREWRVEGLQCAGRPALQRTQPGTAVEVATGAILPMGCDAVVPYEDTLGSDRVRHDRVELGQDLPLPAAGRHVHHRGSDYRQNQVLLPAGTRLRSPHLHTLATVGAVYVEVVRRAQWALAATGDELVEVHQTPQPWQIRRSNAAAIEGEASAWGLRAREQVVLADHRESLLTGIANLLPGLDVLVLTGGVSAGVLDLVPGVLTALGAQVVFHKIAQRPGKPFWCGQLPNTPGVPGPVVFGLPGNPVSSLFSFRRYVLPWLLAFEGRPETERRVTLASPEEPRGQHTAFLPWSQQRGVLAWQGSGDFAALADSTGFVEIGDERSLSEPRYYPWGGS